MTPTDKLAALDPQLIAILRGIKLGETEDIVTGLIETGFRAIEITLNSPEPLKSIELAVDVARKSGVKNLLIGAGTVLTVEEVKAVKEAGGNLIVSPNADADVIKSAVALGMVCLPGVFTPTEAHAALRAGATGLKFFPASLLGSAGIKAIKAILPDHVPLYAVGGVGPAAFAEFRSVGVTGFGLGSDLYKAGKPVEDVMASATKAIAAMESGEI